MADKPAPKPGHFLPGGEGEQGATEAPRQIAAPSAPTGGSAPLTAPTPRLGGEAPPTPPQLQGTRIDPRRTTLSGSRLGPPPADDRAAAAYREVFHPEPIPFYPKKRSKGLIALVVVAALLVVGGGVTFALKVIGSGDFAVNPMPTEKPTDGSKATNEPVGKGTPDADIVGKNAIYAAGKMPVVKCQEPAFRPTSMENVRSYYAAVIACMDKAWEPIVTKAGFEFRSPRLIIYAEGDETACGVQKDLALYCQDDQGGSATMPWQNAVEAYPKNKAQVRAAMAQAIGFVYGVHIQNLTGMVDASDNIADTAASKAAELEQKRRASLQAYCFGGVFFGAARASFPLRGELLAQWNGLIRRSGDDIGKGKVHEHGSSRSLALWINQGLASTNPGSCNTFVAASAKVS